MLGEPRVEFLLKVTAEHSYDVAARVTSLMGVSALLNRRRLPDPHVVWPLWSAEEVSENVGAVVEAAGIGLEGTREAVALAR